MAARLGHNGNSGDEFGSWRVVRLARAARLFSAATAGPDRGLLVGQAGDEPRPLERGFGAQGWAPGGSTHVGWAASGWCEQRGLGWCARVSGLFTGALRRG